MRKLLLLVILLYLTVLSGQEPISLGVHFVRSPESAVAPKGDEVVFECELNLKPDHLEWRFRSANDQNTYKNNVHYVNVQENITNEDRASKLRIFVSADTIGEYQCVAWIGSAAIASTSARLTLASITVDTTNDNRSRNNVRYNVAPKNYVIIRCGYVISNPPAIWTFYHNGNRLASPEVYNGAMVLNLVSSKDSGEYSCSATNTIIGKEVVLGRKIDLHVGYSERTPPYFLNNPSREISTRVGENILLECPGVGTPPPEAVWSSPNIANINNNRTQVLPYGLRITDVVAGDQGSYICRLDNGIAPAPVHTIKLNVLERPKIFHGPPTTLTNEGDSLELECTVSGNPSPEIFWLINGADTSFDNETYQDGTRLFINHVQKRHAGIVQCFAKNDLGEVSHGSLLQVKPTQISGDEHSGTLGNVPSRLGNDHANNKNKKRKYNRLANMIPPSRPNVTRLSDNSVMLRWNVVPNSGLPIQFFKVQYRMLGDVQHTIPRESWQTTNEDIPFGKPDPNDKVIKNFTSSVSGLKAGRFYRFRIIAVYSNNDNKEGNVSAKFCLHYGAELEPYTSKLPTPQLSEIEPVTENSVRIHWVLLPNNTKNSIEGFYAYYRPASSAGDYLKITIDGAHTQNHRIDMLESDTTYEFKLQSFNEFAASEFSTIKQGKTKKHIKTLPSVKRPEIKKTEVNSPDHSNYILTAGVTSVFIILLIVTFIAFICIKRRKNAQVTENKPQLAHIRTDFVATSVLGSPNHHKNRHTHMNGVLPHMNITSNPLAQTADKENKTEHSSQLSPIAGGWDYQQPIQLHQSHNAAHQNKNNFHHHHQHPHQNHQNQDFYQQHYLSQQLSASGLPSTAEYHGLLECNTNTLNCRPQEQQNKTSNIDSVAVRKPPLHPSCHALAMEKNDYMHNTSNSLASGVDSPGMHASPQPSRTMMKRSRMGNNKMNMSSGSLDSIEV